MQLVDRFKGNDGRPRLVEALKKQAIVNGSDAMAGALAAVATVEQFAAGETLIRQGEADNDLLLILAERVTVFVNSREVASLDLSWLRDESLEDSANLRREA